MLALLLLFACTAGPQEPPPAPAVPPATAVGKSPGALPTPASTLILGEADANGNETVLSGGATNLGDPAQLYGSCKQRVEGAEAAGECKVDADCARAGCSKEVCVTATLAPTVNTMCDTQPCFAVLDTCGCHEGLCSWTIKTTPSVP